MTYIKEVFDVTSLEQAAHVALSFDPQNPLKFFNETKYIIDELEKLSLVNSTSLVLDFGCGMGRVSRELIARFQCSVIGLDTSPSMLEFGADFVENPSKFKPVSAYNTPQSIDVCICTFVLQHVENPNSCIDTILKALKPGGILVLVNELKRFVPTHLDRQNYVIWEDDEFDVFKALEKMFIKIDQIPYLNPKLDIVLYKKRPSLALA